MRENDKDRRLTDRKTTRDIEREREKKLLGPLEKPLSVILSTFIGISEHTLPSHTIKGLAWAITKPDVDGILT